ncbi:transient receptor potential cation channel subfamily V member 5-like isoform X3 [Pomacea canaliculata]|uniref:transient receptor potential cation channel subfamily V member 5-like isoform X3 n=1 Tax=Pomacea canaliculata TaxID=400727 RepID=UPI000D7284A1|nr:transient receptor potential cation channel subfamily V member 5-like isoform X3 [Pomacea canaliculata]
MGNTSSSVVASTVKNQGDVGARELYRLVGLGDNGELVRLTKLARWTKNYSQLDQAIQKEVPQFLYNDGEGRKVPIAELVKIRNKDRETSMKISKDRQKKANELALIDMLTQQDAEAGGYQHSKPAERMYREVCWDLDKRGTVGETILHLCLLNATQIHADLAKRLLQFYPKLINDIYVGEEYYGETILHIAIVNEDPAMVKFLLDNGADVHARACGNFFCPDDQKDSRTDSLDHEWVSVCENTNYEGFVYWGEYPLSFAACLGQEECVRLMLAKGADPSLQDTNGNTVLHLLVIHDKKHMFDLILSHGGRLDIKNRQGLTPLTLAAKLARKEMYEHILEKERQVYWIYGNVTCAGYPLTHIDTISPTGEINTDSALNIIVYGGDESHLDMMDGLIVNLLMDKWKTFARFRFYRRFVAFVVYFVMFVIAFALRPAHDPCESKNETESMSTCSQEDSENSTLNPCYLLQPYRDEDIARLVLEACVLLGAVVYLFLAMKEIHHQGFHIFFCTLSGAPGKALLLLSCVFVVMMLPGRAFCAHVYEDVMGVLAILTTAPYFLFFCRGFRMVGPSVYMIYKMVKGDLLRFFIIYVVIVIGFSQALFIPFRDSNTTFSSWWETPMGLFTMSVGQFEDMYGCFEELSSPFSEMTKIMFVVYMIMATLLLINMLIAMMGNTYELVTNTQKEWFRQWARIVLMMELSVTPSHRLQQQMKYSQPMDGNKRAFVVRWHQTDAEKEELVKVRLQNKIQQRFMAQKKNTLRILNKTQRKIKAATMMLKPSS